MAIERKSPPIRDSKRIVYRLTVPKAGRYEVRVSYVSAPNRASNVPVMIEHAAGKNMVLVNQKKTPPIDGLFLSLGTFLFTDEKPAVVTISNEATDGIVGADVVQLLPQAEQDDAYGDYFAERASRKTRRIATT